jgi:hypothetical protein
VSGDVAGVGVARGARVARVATVAIVAVALAGCADSREPPPVVGEPPPECEAQVPPGSDDVGLGPAPVTWLDAMLPTIDPDCTASLVLQVDGSIGIRWRDGAQDRYDVVPARRRSRWHAVGGTCHVELAVEVLGGPAGRAARVTPCQVGLTSAAWASLEGVVVTAEVLAVDAARFDVGWRAVWSDRAPGAACRDAVPVDFSALGLAVVVEAAVSIADWRRMHGSVPPVLAVGMTIEAR